MVEFVDGVKMNLESPDTFHIPEQDHKSEIAPGTYIKVGVLLIPIGKINSERFWVEVTKNDTVNQVITGRVDNDLIATDCHGLRYNDIIEVPYNAVLSIME